MFNTIILLEGYARLTYQELKKFTKGGTIISYDNADSGARELQRWDISEKETAKAELAKYRCEYSKDIALYNITEYALEYCTYNNEGEFVEGSDYDFAEEGRADF